MTNQLRGSQYVTSITNLKRFWLQSSSIHLHDEDQEDVWSQNPKVQIHSNFFKKEMNYVMNFVSIHNLLEQSLLNACATCVLFDGF